MYKNIEIVIGKYAYHVDHLVKPMSPAAFNSPTPVRGYEKFIGVIIDNELTKSQIKNLEEFVESNRTFKFRDGFREIEAYITDENKSENMPPIGSDFVIREIKHKTIPLDQLIDN